MKQHKSSRKLQREIDLRRQISAALAPHLQPSLAGKYSHTSDSSMKAHLLPLDEHGQAGQQCQIEVKEFDERSVTFQHPRPLHDRRALVVLEGPNLGRIAAEVDLTWCRFSGRGQYTSGGRFVSLVGMSA